MKIKQKTFVLLLIKGRYFFGTPSIATGIILRSKASWYEEGQKNNKVFWSLEKRDKTKSHIRKLIDVSGGEITDQRLYSRKLNLFI